MTFVEQFAAFWSNPDPDLVPGMLTPDVQSRWPGMTGELSGSGVYRDQIAMVLSLIPDLRLTVASSSETDDLVFIEWRATGTLAGRPLHTHGIDRFKMRDGKVYDATIAFDPTFVTEALQAASA